MNWDLDKRWYDIEEMMLQCYSVIVLMAIALIWSLLSTEDVAVKSFLILKLKCTKLRWDDSDFIFV